MNEINYLEQGLKAASAADYQQAINAFSKAITARSSLIEAYFNRGLAYLKMGCYAFVIEDFSHVLSAPESNAAAALPQDMQILAYCYRGRAYHFLGYCKQALEDCDRALDLNFYCSQAYQRRSLVKLDLGWRQEALEDLQTAAYLHREQGNLLSYQKTEKLIQTLFPQQI